MTHVYPSSISRKQFAIIWPILESVRKKTKLLIYMMFFVEHCMFKKWMPMAYDASRFGACAMNILEYGAKLQTIKLPAY